MPRTVLVWEDKAGVEHLIQCDALTDMSDERTATVTRHPIENGSTVSDHVIQNPDRLLLEIRHSNKPIYPDKDMGHESLELKEQPNAFKPRGLLAIHSAAGALVSSILGKAKPLTVYTLQSSSAVDRIVELHDKLIEAKQNGYSCSAALYGRQYENFVITSIRYQRTGNGEGGKGKFQVELETVLEVSTASTELPNPQDLHAKPQTNRGTKPSKPTGADEIPPGSLLHQLTSGLGASLGGSIR